MKQSLIDSFKERFAVNPEVCSSAPGRINLIGEHTDYNLGYVLPAAIHMRVFFLASIRTDRVVRVWADDFNQERIFSLDDSPSAKHNGWIDYVKGVYWVLSRGKASLKGINAFVCGDIPIESGLSSSAAFEISIIGALNELFGLNLSRLEMATLSQKAENDFVGVQCGLMDPFISVFGKKDTALWLDCETLQYERIPLLLDKAGLSLIVYDTKVHRDLATSEYNTRRWEAAQALEVLKNRGVKGYKEVELSLLQRAKTYMDTIQFKRARHVVTENERVGQAVSALKNNDFDTFGELLFESHKSLRDDYEVSCPELDLLFECGQSFPFCLGARLTGAGFGGSGIALVERESVDDFQQKVSCEAKRKGFKNPGFYKVKMGEGMKIHGPVED